MFSLCFLTHLLSTLITYISSCLSIFVFVSYNLQITSWCATVAATSSACHSILSFQMDHVKGYTDHVFGLPHDSNFVLKLLECFGQFTVRFTCLIMCLVLPTDAVIRWKCVQHIAQHKHARLAQFRSYKYLTELLHKFSLLTYLHISTYKALCWYMESFLRVC